MSENDRQALADAFDREIDPLADHASTFDHVDVDVFGLFIEDVLRPKDPAESTIVSYERTIEEWSEFMQGEGRHPACPHEDHVKRFVRRELDEKGNTRRTAKKKLWELNKIYKYWQNGAEFPHPVDYNPFMIAKKKMSLSTRRVKEPPRIPVEDLRDVVRDVKHIRDRAFIVTQLKLGLRASEMANIKISELNITNSEVAEHYPEMGTSPHVSRFENAVYIPHDREGNKSKRPRILPVDEELRRLWMNYLLIRPDNEQPWLFLSRTSHSQVDDEAINLAWKRHFHPEYEETQQYRAVTSHYGRHRFTTFWRVEQDLNRELIKYMRGDTSAGGTTDPAGGIDHYIHSYYEDIEPLYRERIYKFGI
jgi:integrase/recombinase XerD